MGTEAAHIALPSGSMSFKKSTLNRINKGFPSKGNAVISHWVARVNVFLGAEEPGLWLVPGIFAIRPDGFADSTFFTALAIQCQSRTSV
jgi:hypothetical protein